VHFFQLATHLAPESAEFEEAFARVTEEVCAPPPPSLCSRAWPRTSDPQTLNPKLQTLNTKHETLAHLAPESVEFAEAFARVATHV